MGSRRCGRLDNRQPRRYQRLLATIFREAIFARPPRTEPPPDRPERFGSRPLTKTEREQLLADDRRVSEYARAAFAGREGRSPEES
jgi:hypothetical protein